MRRWVGMGLLAGLLAGVAGCARDVRPPPRTILDDQVIVLVPPQLDQASGRVLDILLDDLPAARHWPYMHWSAGLSNALVQGQIALVPDARTVPAAAWPMLEAYLKAGGQALFIGDQPYAEPRMIGAGADHRWPDYIRALASRAMDEPDFSAIQLWRHQQSHAGARTAVRIASGAGLPWPGVQVDVAELQTWDHMEWADSPVSLPPDAAALVVHVRGDRRTTRLVFEAVTGEGTHWVHVAPLSEDWQPLVLKPDDWRYIGGGAQPGGAPEPFALARLAALRVGLNQAYAPLPPGAYQYGVSDLRVLTEEDLQDWPQRPAVPFLADPDRRHRFPVSYVHASRSAGRFRLRAIEADAVHWHTAARYADVPARWVSLFTAQDRSGRATGMVGGLFVHQPDDAPLKFWGWVGLPIERATRHAIRAMINESLFFMQRGRFLIEVDIPKRVFNFDETIQLRAQVHARESSAALVRVTVEIIDAEDEILRRVVSAPFSFAEVGPGLHAIDLNAGAVPRVPRGTADMMVRVGMEEVGGRMRLLDRVSLPIKVNAAEPEPFRLDPPRIFGGRISSGRVPLTFIGIDYHPGLNGRLTDDWLQPARFPARQIREDLARLRDVGVNAIGLSYTDPALAHQLRYVLAEAREQEQWVQLRLPLALQWSRQEQALETALAAVGLPQEPTVFSIDLTPDTRRYPGEEAELHQRWTRWLEDHYGALTNIPPAWREWLTISDDVARYPSADALARIPETAPVWPTLRRFANDLWSREFGYVVRRLRAAGYAGLVTARWRTEDSDMTNRRGVRLPLDPSALTHMDYTTITPDGWMYSPPRLGAEAFKAALASGMGHGRPILWAEWPSPVGPRPRREDFNYQADSIEDFFRLVQGTDAVGGWLSHMAPVSERPDFADEGLIDFSRAPRPAYRALSAAANRLRAYRMRPIDWGGREANMEWGASGWWADRENWAQVYLAEVQRGRMAGIRPLGYGEWTTDIPVRHVGDEARGALRDLNAEWGQLRVDRREFHRRPGESLHVQARQTVSLELWNTGHARWAASVVRGERTVWLSVEREALPTQYLEVSATPPGGRVILEWQPVDPGLYRLRPYWLGIGPFGEGLTVRVEEPPYTP